MKIFALLLLYIPSFAQYNDKEIAAWKQQAERITITRDVYGVAHVVGKTDADAVFGMLYAQCEDDFERVERNYIVNSGRQAEVQGAGFIFSDLRMRLFIDTTQAITLYKDCPAWMKKVCQGFADGINYYLYTHPTVKPKLLKRFQPWMPLLFSEGSIGGDIESISLDELKSFYGEASDPGEKLQGRHLGGKDARGSNGFAIAPSKSASGKALLWINPHTSFYFRSELQVTSDEGLHAYGAATWGQFFIYQGFNEHCGWMHTSSAADVIDEYSETVTKKGQALLYQYGSTQRSLQGKKIQIAYRDGDVIKHRDFTGYHTGHGPVVAIRDGKWISVKLMQEPVKALTQSFLRTKSNSLADFKKVMELKTNSSNNTVYADDKGNICYWHGNFMPRRDTKFDWTNAVDGSNPETEWKGLHGAQEMIYIQNPKTGWIQNCNATPFTASGSDSPDKTKYPSYMAPDPENARGLHAVRVLKDETSFTPDKLIAAAYDSYLPGFEKFMPALVEAMSTSLPPSLDGPYAFLKDWDLRCGESSVATTLAIYCATNLYMKNISKMADDDRLAGINYISTNTTAAEKIEALSEAVKKLEADFGTWKMPWGEVNRFQRLTGKIESVFDDTKPSLPVGFTSSLWGSLAAFEARPREGTKKLYGSTGNSFVAVVEFGDKVRAKSVMTGGASGDPASAHFFDQGEMYTKGKFKDVLFYKEDLAKQIERTYTPGK